MATRALTGLAAALLAAGCCIAAAGLHPAVANVTISRCGFVLILGSLPAWMVTAVRRATFVTAEQLSDARLSGYQFALDEFGITQETPPATDADDHRRTRTGDVPENDGLPPATDDEPDEPRH